MDAKAALREMLRGKKVNDTIFTYVYDQYTCGILAIDKNGNRIKLGATKFMMSNKQFTIVNE